MNTPELLALVRATPITEDNYVIEHDEHAHLALTHFEPDERGYIFTKENNFFVVNQEMHTLFFGCSNHIHGINDDDDEVMDYAAAHADVIAFTEAEYHKTQPQLFTPKKESKMIINNFHGEYGFLSNFYGWLEMADTLWGYPTAEHAYQAAKTTDLEQRKAFKSEDVTPGQAKRMGRKLTLRPDWEDVKEEVMLIILRKKFSVPALRQKLLDTGDAILIEGNNWHDNIWGDCSCSRCNNIEGQNLLGKLLMQIREENE